MDGNVVNNFASVLVFYDQFKRSKLVSSDLIKIAKKYGSKSEQLVIDLEKKYGFPIPKECNLANVIRICQIYSVPVAYLQLMPESVGDINAIPFDAIYDIRSPLFDPDKVISSRRIIASNMTNDILDNLSKCRPFLTNYDGKIFTFDKYLVKVAATNKHLQAPPEKYVHVLDAIGKDSSAQISSTNEEGGGESLQMSPFALAYTFMKEKIRVRVIMRKKNRCSSTLFYVTVHKQYLLF